jgi:predicted  nucleic acid-binding Zn-ribbon protein
MTQHALREHDVELDRYGCIRCGETFGNNRSLCMQHVQTCHRLQKMEDRKNGKATGGQSRDQIAQEVLTQLASMAATERIQQEIVVEADGTEVVLGENEEQDVQYIIMDTDGNVLETLDVKQGQQLQIETNEEMHNGEMVTYALAQEEVPEYVLVKNEDGKEEQFVVQDVVADGTEADQ